MFVDDVPTSNEVATKTFINVLIKVCWGSIMAYLYPYKCFKTHINSLLVSCNNAIDSSLMSVKFPIDIYKQ